MNLNKLLASSGKKEKRKRIGRGPGSGHGKTSCRGEKGQKARKGYSQKFGFEGGQFPLYRRIPKRGFTNPNKKVYGIINVSQLNSFDDKQVVDQNTLLDAGLLKKNAQLIKLLGNGNVDKSIEIHVHAASRTAIKKVKSAKGRVVIKSICEEKETEEVQANSK